MFGGYRMKRTFSGLFSAFVLCAALLSPAFAKKAPVPPSDPVPVSSSTPSDSDDAGTATVPVTVSSSVPSPTAPKVPVTSSVPAVAPVAAPTTPKTPKPSELTPESVAAGNLTLSHGHVSVSGDSIDVFLTIKNAGTNDEKIIGAGTSWDKTDVVEVTKKDGKEVESPLNLPLPAGKTVEVSNSEIWVRVKGVTREDKAGGYLPITFYFRSAPNTTLKLSFKDSGVGSTIMNWFGK